MEKWNPEQLRKSTERLKNESELLAGHDRGRLTQDLNPETQEPLEPRLEISEQTLARKRAFNEILGGLFNEATIDAYFQSGEKEFTFIFGKGIEYTVKIFPSQELTISRWMLDKDTPRWNAIDFTELKRYVKEYIKKHFINDIENFKKKDLP